MLILKLVVAMAAGAAVFFLISWFQEKKIYASMTEIERRNTEIAATAKKAKKGTLLTRVKNQVKRAGWKGDLTPLWVAWGLTYLVIIMVLVFLGINSIIGAVVAVPATFLVSYMALVIAAGRRRTMFQMQLVQVLDLLVAQLKAGSSPARAFDEIIPALPEPARSEFSAAADQARASRPLVEAVEDIAVKYPSRALNLMIAALAIDREKGGQITNSLEQASNMVRRDLELTSEAKAELAQSKAELIGIAALIGAMVAITYFSADEQTRQAFADPFSLIIGGIGFLWYLFGIYRGLHKVNQIQSRL